MHVHEPQDAIWLFASMSLLDTASIDQVPVTSGFSGYLDVHLRKSVHYMLSTDQNPCSNDPRVYDDISRKVRSNMVKVVKQRATCFLPEYLYLVNRSGLGHLGDCEKDHVSLNFLDKH